MKSGQPENVPLRKGLSITEIIVVVVMMGILSAVATIAYLDHIKEAHLASLEQRARNFFKAMDVRFIGVTIPAPAAGNPTE